MEKLKNIPSLRFPEFDGEWKTKKLGELAERVTTKNKENNINVLTISAQHGLISQMEYFTKSVSAKNVSGYYLLSKDDFAYNKSYSNGYPMGAIKRLKRYEKGVVSTLYICFRFSNYIENSFIEQFFETGNQNIEIEKVAQEGARNHGLLNIGLADFFSINIPFTTLPEQTKIASFLTAVDEKIQQLSRKKELLEQYKKGVTQQLFSGKLRFKDENGKDYPDWEKKKLGEVSTKKSSNISANKIEDNIGEFIIYGASGILKKVDFYKEENDYISIVKDGAGVGRLFYCKGKSSVLGTMEIISPKQNIDTYFLYCLLSNIDFVKYVTGSTIPHIYFKDYSNEFCGIPSLQEQQKIAAFLSSIDTKIESTCQQINQTQSFKKGLLQQLFV